MRYCPECKMNFDIIQEHCPSCHTVMINFLDGKQGATQPDNSWVVVGGVINEYNFEVAKGTLDSNNIPSVFMESVDDDNLKNLTEQQLEEINHNIIMVPREYKNEALYILIDILGDNLKRINSNNSKL